MTFIILFHFSAFIVIPRSILASSKVSELLNSLDKFESAFSVVVPLGNALPLLPIKLYTTGQVFTVR